MASGLTLNGTDVQIYGTKVISVSGYMGGTTRTLTLGALAGVPGQRLLAPAAEPARDITVNLLVEGATVTQCRTNFDLLQAALLAVPCVVIFQDNPNRQITVTFLGIDVPAPNGPQFLQRRIQITAKFKALDPLFYDTSDTTLSAITTSFVNVPTGTGPSSPVLTIVGAATNPLVSLNNAAGALVRSIGFTISLAGGDTLVIDMANRSAAKNGVSVLTNITSGDFFAIDPTLADYVNSTWAKIKVSSGTMSLTYRKTWR